MLPLALFGVRGQRLFRQWNYPKDTRSCLDNTGHEIYICFASFCVLIFSLEVTFCVAVIAVKRLAIGIEHDVGLGHVSYCRVVGWGW